jgi:thioredoxin-like negative regulator of GroEL
LIFIDLFADWCGWCHRMEKEVFPSEPFQKATGDMVLLRLNTEDRAEGTKFAQQYEIRSLPTFMVVAPDLSVAGVIMGYAPAPQFVQKLAETRKEYQVFQKRVKDEPTYQKDYQKRLDLAKEFIGRRGFGEAERRLNKLVNEAGAPQGIRDSASYNLALAMVSQKKYDASLALLNKLLSRVSTGEPAEMGRILLGQLYYEQGNFGAALRELNKFKSSFPNSKMIASVNSLIPQLELQAKVRQQ